MQAATGGFWGQHEIEAEQAYDCKIYVNTSHKVDPLSRNI